MGDHAPPGGRLSEAAVAAAEPDDELVEAGRRLFAGACRFVAGAATAGAVPGDTLPEIAFIGRSNVGKSSLVNALTGRRMLARTSRSPGRTRQLNFFDLGGRLMLVDLPGYGYAEAPKAQIQGWTALTQRYLTARGALRRACLLIDARHGLKDPDRPLMRLLDAAGVSYQIVLTKADKLSAAAVAGTIAAVADELAGHPAAHPDIAATSASAGTGIALLRAALCRFALPAA